MVKRWVKKSQPFYRKRNTGASRRASEPERQLKMSGFSLHKKLRLQKRYSYLRLFPGREPQNLMTDRGMEVLPPRSPNNITDSTNRLTYLLNCCEKEDREAMTSRTTSDTSEGYAKAWDILRRHFGNAVVIVRPNDRQWPNETSG